MVGFVVFCRRFGCALKRIWIFTARWSDPRSGHDDDSALMTRFLELAAENGCEEAWLATESDNLPAQRLYESFDSAEGEAIIGYAFDMSQHSE